MKTNDFLTIIGGVTISLGGGGAIVLGLSNYFGHILANRYGEKIKARYQNQINEYQKQLDVIKQVTLRYSERQFAHYSKLWSSLYDLKILADELWEEASSERLVRFSKQLKSTTMEIEKASLFIEDSHYQKLNQLLHQFSNYEIGKSTLIDYRNAHYANHNEVESIVASNSNFMEEYRVLIFQIKADLKRQLRGD